MAEYQKFTPEMKEYFDALPPFIQECIMQSGVELGTCEDMRDFADHLMGQ